MEPGSFLSSLDTKKLNQLYSAHRNIRALCVLWILGAVILSIGILYNLFKGGVQSPLDAMLLGLLAFLVLLQIVAVVGLYQRPKWGRILGIVVSCLALLNLPIGTVIGIFCIYTLGQSAELFGPDRIRPEELKAEYLRRKTAGSGSK